MQHKKKQKNKFVSDSVQHNRMKKQQSKHVVLKVK